MAIVVRPSDRRSSASCTSRSVSLSSELVGLVEDQDRRVAQDRPRDRNALLLATGEAVAALPHDRVVAIRKSCDYLVDAGRLRRLLEFLVGRVRLCEAQVLADRGVEQIRLLRDDTYQVAQSLEAQIADVDAVDRDPPAADLIEPRSEVPHRRLARTRSRQRGPSSMPAGTVKVTSLSVQSAS